MQKIIYLFILSLFVSCFERKDNSDSKKNQDSKLKTNNSKEKPFKPEYPLVRFYLDDNISEENKTENGFPDGVNDLKIDKSNPATIMVSFDREGGVGCEWRGKMSPNFKNGKWDTVFLDYYEFCPIEDEIVDESAELRFYFEITDASSYDWCVFMPRQIENPQ